MKKTHLFTPGPTMVPPECLLEMSRPIIHHRTAEYREMFSAVRENLKYVFRTENEVLCLSSSGTGAMEAGVVNLLSPGDKAIVVRGGKFGERFEEIASAYGVEAVPLNVEWGKAAKPEDIKRLLSPDIKAVYATLCETSTGTASDIEAIARLTAESPACLVVDAISGLGCMELETDKWGVDVVVSGSQKGLMIPPGLGFISLNEKAWKMAGESSLPKYYFDLGKAKKAQLDSDSAFTPPISLVAGLNAALAMLKDEGIENAVSRHRLMAEAVRAAVGALGLRLFSESPADSLTAVEVPDGVDGEAFVKDFRKMGVYIAGGQGRLKGKIFRLAHMGYMNELDVLQMISAVELGLAAAGFKFEAGSGSGAAEKVFAGKR